MGYSSGLTTASINGNIISAVSGFYNVADTPIIWRLDASKEPTAQDNTYYKVKYFTLPASFPTTTLRIKFTMDPYGSSGTAYGRIYKNGVAAGTERSASYSGAATEYSEDISFTGGDTIELWAKTSGASCGVYMTLFRITGTFYQFPNEYLSVTGADV